jgi:hypothetical protein
MHRRAWKIDAIGAQHEFLMPHERLDQFVVAQMEHDEHRQPFLNQKIAEGVCGLFAGSTNVGVQSFADPARVVRAREPGDVDVAEVVAVQA